MREDDIKAICNLSIKYADDATDCRTSIGDTAIGIIRVFSTGTGSIK